MEHLVVLVKAALMGVVEGVTEFLPVSSTGHLILAGDLLGFAGPKENAFLVIIQVGAILAVLWLYRGKFLGVARNLRSDPAARRLVFNLGLGTLPAVVIGLPTERWIEAHLFRPLPVAIAFAAGGVAILWVEARRRKPAVLGVDDIPLGTALAVGCFQVLAVVFPGVSRSGATIIGGLLLGLSRTAAAEFSFFLAIPALLGASLVKYKNVYPLLTAQDFPFFAVGFLVSFVAAMLVIRGFLAYVSRRSFAPFAWYRIAFGALLLYVYGVQGTF